VLKYIRLSCKKGILASLILLSVISCKHTDKAQTSKEKRHHKTIPKNYKPLELEIDSSETGTFFQNWREKRELNRQLKAFYRERYFVTLWLTDKYRLSPKAEELLAALENCKNEGLPDGRYRTAQIRNLLSQAKSLRGESDTSSAHILSNLDLLLSTELFRYAADMSEGFSRFDTDKSDWFVRTTWSDIGILVKKVLTSEEADAFAGLEPPHGEYRQLKRMLSRYTAGEKKGESSSWPAMQLRANMERWRLLPRDFPKKFIFVNIPEFMLHAYKDGTDTFDMPVIVGKEFNPTPIMNDVISYIVFSPFWVVPKSIAKKEVIPYVYKDPNSLDKNDMEVVYEDYPGHTVIVPFSTVPWANIDQPNFKYYIRQRSGKKNLLGKVKFVFPNTHDVYLHDTPFEDLFKTNKRGYSHGCIRVGDPMKLTEFLLAPNEEKWDKKLIREAMEKKVEKVVRLKQKVQVYILYFTAWIDHKGNMALHEDIYGHDSTLAKNFGAGI
jgi:murein L,D-transpeptidase YcbB/YkuD